jgi:hypothetical protein
VIQSAEKRSANQQFFCTGSLKILLDDDIEYCSTIVIGGTGNIYNDPDHHRGLPLLIVGILMILLYGGLRTRINRENITVNFGLLPFKVLNLKVSSIDHVNYLSFLLSRILVAMAFVLTVK